MANDIVINISEVLGKENAVSSEDAEKLRKIFKESIEQNHPIDVSFSGTEIVLTVFLNQAFGELFKDYCPEDIVNNINFIDLSPSLTEKINLVREHAIEFYRK